MSSIDNFLSEVYSEEQFSFSEEEYAEVMSAATVEGDEWSAYGEWSSDVEAALPEGDLENFQIINGQLRYKGEGQKRGPFVGGIEV